MSQRAPAVDDYIAKAKPFAQPILRHLREAVHRAVPDVEEHIKWSMPFFVYRGIILANMAGHKEHCAFGLWGKEITAVLHDAGISSGGNMGSLGRLTSLDDLPPTPALESYIREAAKLIGDGKRTRSIQRVAKPARPEPSLPDALAAALKGNKTTAARFAKLSPTSRREYAEWIASAKRDGTRAKRLATALAWIAEGKGLNWKYERSA